MPGAPAKPKGARSPQAKPPQAKPSGLAPARVKSARGSLASPAAQTADTATANRKSALSAARRELILDAARRVFEAEGLEGASLRAIAAEAGYTPAALYFHFDSKEALYDQLLQDSLAALSQTTRAAAAGARSPAEMFRAASLSFFAFYAEHPRDLDMGFYLFRGGMAAKGLGRARDKKLNAALWAALEPIASAAVALGAEAHEARRVTADVFAFASGALLLAHTGRVRMFDVAAGDMMHRFVETTINQLRPP